MGNDNRVDPGVPAGGQFAAQNRPDGETLDSTNPEGCIHPAEQLSKYDYKPVPAGAPLVWPDDDFIDIEQEESYLFSHADGDFDGADTVFETVEVYRCGDDSDEPRSLRAEASVIVDFHLLSSNDSYLAAHAGEIDKWLRENHEDLRIGGYPGDVDWDNLELVADIDFRSGTFPKTIEGLIEAGKTRTGFASLDFRSESGFWTGLKSHLDSRGNTPD